MSVESSSPFDALARSTINAAWGALAMEVLARLGVESVVSSPGSRSTPLVYAAVRNAKLEVIPVLDERAAAFFALGLAKRTGRPTVLVCTSGTALANYAPAVAEADHSGTPLIILTADRSLEERACGAGQTLDQVKYFGSQVRHFAELLLPEANLPALRYLRQTLVHALDRSLQSNPGPVHLNFPFRDPLVPDLDPNAVPVIETADLESAATVITRSTEAVAACHLMDAVAIERLSSHQKGLIIVGDFNPTQGDAGGGAAFAQAVAQLSTTLGWPVLADVLNPLRAHANSDAAPLTQYDAILRDLNFESESESDRAAALAPTAILQIGALPTSKTLRAWLRDLDAVTFLLANRPANLDPLHRVATLLHGDAATLVEVIEPQKAAPGWMQSWHEAEAAQLAKNDAKLTNTDALFGGKAPWLLSKVLPAEAAVFFANSMSVRYAEMFWRVRPTGGAQIGNRGVNGIDGNLATAVGLAHGGAPAVCLIGDLAFLHDYSALLLAGQMRGSLTIVLLNNAGGGVFEFLPIAQHNPPFEKYFATPQTVDVSALCAAHAIHHQTITDWQQFEDACKTLPAGVRVLELKTDRKIDHSTHLNFFKQ